MKIGIRSNWTRIIKVKSAELDEQILLEELD